MTSSYDGDAACDAVEGAYKIDQLLLVAVVRVPQCLYVMLNQRLIAKKA